MGVRGLFSYVLRSKEKTVENIDLVAVALEKHGLEILVDYYAFQHLIVDRFWQGLSSTSGNPYLRLEGGEYNVLHQCVTKLVDNLSRVGIHLVFYVDAGKGVNQKQTAVKIDTWKSRHRNDQKKLWTLLDICAGNIDIHGVPFDTNIRPVCLEIQIFESLKQSGARIIHCIEDEADVVIAADLLKRPKAFAVLSNDSDFFLINNCRFIPLKLFDADNDLQLSESCNHSEKLTKLKVGLVTVDRVQQLFGFRTHEQLIEFAIICGNDFTQPVLTSYIKDKIGIRKNASFGDLAGWVIRHRCVENHHFMQEELSENFRLKQAILHSREFYSLKSTKTEFQIKGPLTTYLIETVSNGALPSNILAMHYNFYWHRMLLEDVRKGQPSIEWILADLRSFIYKIALPRSECEVIEYGSSSNEDIQSSGIKAAQCLPDGSAIRTADYIQSDRIGFNLRALHLILTHQEPGFKEEYFRRFGRWNGFLCYLLRYFLKLNWKKNLHLTEDEFISIVAGLFHNEYTDTKLYQSIDIKPDVRCVTIINWFQALYRYCYDFLAKLFYLEHEFPKPKDIFAGSVWTVFIMCSRHKFNHSENLNILDEDLLQVLRDHKHILRENRRIIQCVVEDMFHLNYRF